MHKIILEYDTPVKQVTPDKWAKDAAAAIASGKRVKGHDAKASGSFSTAYMKGFLAVKGVEVWEDPADTPVDNYLTWLTIVQNAMSKPYFRQIANKYIAPCTILNKTVIVQNRVVATAAELNVSTKLASAVELLGLELGILDMHEENWGFDVHGQIKMFDMMPLESFCFNEVELRYSVKEVETAMKNWLAGKFTRRKTYENITCDCHHCNRNTSSY